MKYLTLIFAAILLASCATVFKGTKQVVKIKDLPEAATVYHNGARQPDGTTRVKVQRKEPGTITIKQEGCNTQYITLSRKPSIGFIAVDIIAGLVPLPIDFITGAIYKSEDIIYIPDCN